MGRTCGCHRGEGIQQSECTKLNCYNDDKDVMAAVGALSQKLRICTGAVALSRGEIKENGPVPQNDVAVYEAGEIQDPGIVPKPSSTPLSPIHVATAASFAQALRQSFSGCASQSRTGQITRLGSDRLKARHCGSSGESSTRRRAEFYDFLSVSG